MNDRMKIVGKDGKERYILEGETVTDVREHDHVIVSDPQTKEPICRVCKLSLAEIMKVDPKGEDTNATS